MRYYQLYHPISLALQALVIVVITLVAKVRG